MTRTNLVDLADRVTTTVQQGAQKERVAEQVAQLKRIEASVSQLFSVVAATGKLVDAAVGAGIDVPIAGLQSLAGPLDEVAAKAANREVDGSAVDRLVIDIRSQLTTIQGAITISWRDLVDRKVPQREGLMRLAETFRQLDASSRLATELRTALVAARDLAGSPPTLTGLNTLESIAERVPKLLRDLVGDDPNVRLFADELARGGASVDALTPAVIAWIRARGFDRSFKIVPGEPAE